MPYQQYDNRVNDLVKLYRTQPHLFTEEQLDELEEITQQNNIPFKRIHDDTNLFRIAKNLTSGFIEGMTTLPVGCLLYTSDAADE